VVPDRGEFGDHEASLPGHQINIYPAGLELPGQPRREVQRILRNFAPHPDPSGIDIDLPHLGVRLQPPVALNYLSVAHHRFQIAVDGDELLGQQRRGEEGIVRFPALDQVVVKYPLGKQPGEISQRSAGEQVQR